MRIFVSGPYSANHPRDVLVNVNLAIGIGIELMRRGHAVFIPHLSHYIHLHPSCSFEYEEYMRNDMAWLEVSDAIFVIAKSPGADRELEYAKLLGKLVYFSLDDIAANEIVL